MPRTGLADPDALVEGAPMLNSDPPVGIELAAIPVEVGLEAPKLNPPPAPGVVGVPDPL